jgi:hypothetical protein
MKVTGCKEISCSVYSIDGPRPLRLDQKDVGSMSRWKLMFASLLAVFALSAVASASASAAVEFYNSSGEAIESELAVAGLGGLWSIGTTIAGIKIEVHCTQVHLTLAAIRNAIRGGVLRAIARLRNLFLGCTISASKPKMVEGCEVPKGEIETTELSGLGITIASEPYMEYTPATGTSLGSIILANCKNAGFNGEHEMTGFWTSKANNATSELETNTGSGEVEVGAEPATLKGSYVQEMVGGGTIKLE